MPVVDPRWLIRVLRLQFQSLGSEVSSWDSLGDGITIRLPGSSHFWASLIVWKSLLVLLVSDSLCYTCTNVHSSSSALNIH